MKQAVSQAGLLQSHMLKTTDTVYEAKNIISAIGQVVWLSLGLVELLLSVRLVLKTVGVHEGSQLIHFVYVTTQPIITPFVGSLSVTQINNGVLEWATIVAMFVYACLAWGFVYLLELLYITNDEDK